MNNSSIEQSIQVDSNSDRIKYGEFYTGLTLALLSSFFIGSSFILKKKGLLKLCASNNSFNQLTSTGQSSKQQLRAGQGGYGYLKEWLWWSGLLTMGVGELCNFAAYGFVPATLVTPLGALSVLVSSVLSAYFLNEKLNVIGKIGCFLTAIGSTVMVIHAPKEGEVRSVRELLDKLQEVEFVTFTLMSIFTLFVLIFVFSPRFGNSNILIYILICSILGSFTVMSCKGLSLGIKEILGGYKTVSYYYTFMFGIIALGCIVVQMNYLNKSLDIYNTPIVTTVYYVLFTLFVMLASALLFKEMMNMLFQDFVGCMCGFSTIICALCLIHFFKTTDDQFDQLIHSSHNNNSSNNMQMAMTKLDELSNGANAENMASQNDFLYRAIELKNHEQQQQKKQQFEMSSKMEAFMKTEQINEDGEFPFRHMPATSSTYSQPAISSLINEKQNQMPMRSNNNNNKNLSASSQHSSSSSSSSSFFKKLSNNLKNIKDLNLDLLTTSSSKSNKYSNYNKLVSDENDLSQRDDQNRDDEDENDDYNDDDDEEYEEIYNRVQIDKKTNAVSFGPNSSSSPKFSTNIDKRASTRGSNGSQRPSDSLVIKTKQNNRANFSFDENFFKLNRRNNDDDTKVTSTSLLS
jgi:uncharacterized membrane protein